MAGTGGKREGAGRKKGSGNKISGSLREMVIEAAEKLAKEGKTLHSEAAKDPQWFYVNFIKPMLPKEVHLDSKGTMHVTITSDDSEVL